MRRKAHVRFGGEGEKTHLWRHREVRLALILSANGDSGNGESFGRLAGVADKILAMTGTPFNGRSSSMFNIEYHLNERIRQRYPWGGAQRVSPKVRGSRGYQSILEGNNRQRGRAESKWVADMGVREKVLEERPSYDKDTGSYTGTSTYERPYQEAPGISPLLVAETLDHAIFFSLGDLNKALPEYQEIAIPIALDADVQAEYERTRQHLKDYLVQRRWEGDVTFRGAYLQWSLGWPNATFRPMDVVHNQRHPITGKKIPHVVTKLPSYGADRIFAKEQALIDLVTEELADNRPCVVYLRQTATRDIQPRIEKLIREHVPGAVPYILKNTVSAEKREQVIEREVLKGCNVLICNPELVKTGLDLLHFPTLIFFEIIFNLSTQMQASARAYRLNQTHKVCKTVYLFAENTMEHTAVQLMSRKQRAAKLLTGDLGLTGLDALTEGEGGFESALLDALASEETLLDPRDLFKQAEDASDADDLAFWNVEMDADSDEVLADEPPQLIVLDALNQAESSVVQQPKRVTISKPTLKPSAATGLAHFGFETSVNLDDLDDLLTTETTDTAQIIVDDPARTLSRYVHLYIESLKQSTEQARRKRIPQLVSLLQQGEINAKEDTTKVMGVCDPLFAQYDSHQQHTAAYVGRWLKNHKLVSSLDETVWQEAGQQLVELALMAYGHRPLRLDAFFFAQPGQLDAQQQLEARVATQRTSQAKPAKQTRREPLDRMAVPTDEEVVPTQMAMF